MTITRTWHCHIIRQKSPKVRGKGPAINRENYFERNLNKMTSVN